MEADDPSRRYYRSCEGAWSSPFPLVVTDWRAFWAAPMGWLDRLRVMSMDLLGRLVGPAQIATTVGWEGDDVLHTTHISKWGLTLFRSIEMLRLNADGRSFLLTGEQRVWPLPWRPQPYSARGGVRPDADGATYHIPWMGTEIRQVTRRVPGGLLLTQETRWSRATAVLRAAIP